MKNLFPLLLMFAVAFTACKKDKESGEDTADLSKYIQLDGSKYSEANMPSNESSDLLTALTGNPIILKGGANPFTLSAKANIYKVYVSVESVKGHLEKVVDASESKVIVPVLVGVTPPKEDFIIWLSIADKDGNISNKRKVEVETLDGTNTGNLQVSISWDQLNDVDLHLILPDERVIGYRYPIATFEPEDVYEINYTLDAYVAQQGMDNYNYGQLLKLANVDMKKILAFLDVDSNADCDIDGINNENISFPNSIPDGTYKVNANLFANCSISELTNFIVTTRYNGEVVKTSVGTNPYVGNLPASAEDEWGIGSTVMTFKKSGSSISRTFNSGIEVLKEERFSYLNAVYDNEAIQKGQYTKMMKKRVK